MLICIIEVAVFLWDRSYDLQVMSVHDGWLALMVVLKKGKFLICLDLHSKMPWQVDS